MGVYDTLLWVYSPLMKLQSFLLEQPRGWGLPLCWVTNLSKGAMGPYIWALMNYYDNFSLGCWVYLALHGSYGLLWLTKDLAFRDKTFRAPVGPMAQLATAGILASYHVLPYLMAAGLGQQNPSSARICVCVALYAIGLFWMCASDAQKNFTLQFKAGLIADGMFARTRNPNYLGEVALYSSFMLLINHRAAYGILFTVWGILFMVLMLQKEKSLRRKQGWADYSRRSWMFFPKLVASSDALTYALYGLAVALVARLV